MRNESSAPDPPSLTVNTSEIHYILKDDPHINVEELVMGIGNLSGDVYSIIVDELKVREISFELDPEFPYKGPKYCWVTYAGIVHSEFKDSHLRGLAKVINETWINTTNHNPRREIRYEL